MRVLHGDHIPQYFSNYFGGEDFFMGEVKWDVLTIGPTTTDARLNFWLVDIDQLPHELAVLYGIVVNQDFEPIPGVMVRAYRFDDEDDDGKQDEDETWLEVGNGFTDAEGLYAFLVPNQGPYRVSFEDATFGQNDDDYLFTYYPYAPTIDEAQDIRVDEGYQGTVGVLVAIPDIRGRVLSDRGAPVIQAQVSLFYRDDEVGQWRCCAVTYTDKGGDYEFIDLRPGIYRVLVSASWLGYVNEYYGDATTLEQAQDIAITLGNNATGKDFVLAESGNVAEEQFLPFTSR